jgi:hypothetical protein
MINAAPKDMAEVLVEYDTIVTGADGSRWAAHACGRPSDGHTSDGHMWEGWIEFVPLGRKRSPLRSRRESTQPSRKDLVYWATGLTPIYLKGALTRALQPPFERPAPRGVKPYFDGPAPNIVPAPPPSAAPHPILDPFDVYAQGEDILIRQLDALDTPRLRDIVLAYELMNAPEAKTAKRLDLATAIVEAARASAERV